MTTPRPRYRSPTTRRRTTTATEFDETLIEVAAEADAGELE